MIKINHTCKTCLLTILFIAGLFVLHGFSNYGWGQSQTFTSSGTFTVPAGVTCISIECWGGGGAGGGQNQNTDGGGGGGGGAYSKKLSFTVIPGNSYSVVVGSGGSGVASSKGGDGGDSYFVNTSIILAKGGIGGSPSTGTPPEGGLGGSASAGIGDIKFSGGQGEIGRNNSSGQGGYGGSSAGTAADGWSGPQTWSTATYPTANTPTYAGDGGDGGNIGINGSSGVSPGGGGGGSGEGSALLGGNGSSGKVVISWLVVTASASPNNVCSGNDVNLTTSVTSGTLNSILLSEDFNSATNNWTKTNNSTGGTTANAAWTLRANSYSYSGSIFHSNDNSQFYLSNSDAQGSGTTTSTILQSPALNTIGYTSLSLSFWHHYRYYDGGESGKVEVSTNGSSWTTIEVYSSNIGSINSFVNKQINLDAYVGNAVLYIRYKYDATYDWWWAIDNITITGNSSSYNYSWIGTPSATAGLPAGAGTPSASNASIVSNPTQTTSYIAIVQNTASGCSTTSNTVTVIVNTVPATPVATGSTICVESTATLSASGAVNGDKYIWHDAATNGTILKTSTNYTDNTFLTPVLVLTTNYWVSILNSNGCESARTLVTATFPVISPDDQNLAGTNSWIGHTYDGLNFNSYYGYYSETETFDQNFGGDLTCFELNSSIGNRSIYTSTFSVRYRMNSTKKGLYIADLGSDDGSRLSVDGTLVYNNWIDQSFSSRPRVLMSLNGASSLIYDFNENGGQNRVVFANFIPVLSNTLSSNITQNICLGSSGSTISGDIFGTLPTGITLSGTTGYQWAYSTTSSNGPWINISGATAATYTPSSATAPFNTPGTYYFIRKASLSSTNNVSPNPYTATNESNTASITVTMAVSTPVFILGATSSRCKGSGSVIYTATATNASEITYSLDAASISAGNGINAATGEVTYVAGWSGVSIITASAAGCNGPLTASHSATTFGDFSWTGAINTDWNNSGNWYCGVIPDLTTDVLIPNVTNKPVLSSGAAGTTKNIVIETGSSVTVTGNTLQIAGSITNNGTFTATAGTIEMKGSGAQVIGSNVFSSNTILNLAIDNASGVTLQGPLNITGVVSPVNGALASGGNLTLISTASQTALVDGTGSGSITGNVNMQRYLTSGFGYKYISSPFQSSTANELADDLDLASTFPLLYKYDEDNHRDSSGIAIYSNGWVQYATSSNNLVPMSGYAANFGNSSASKTFDVTGVVNNNILTNQTLFNHNRTYTKGFNLAGNPYPSPIDWDAAAGWTRTNIDNAVYYFDAGTTNQYTGTYSYYRNGVSSNGIAGRIIPSMQGFFVHVADGATGTFGMTNQVRVNNLSPSYHKSVNSETIPLVRLSALYEFEKTNDPAVVCFNEYSTPEFDGEFDALKLMNTDLSVPNLYFLTPQSVKTSINTIPNPIEDITKVPFGLRTEQGKWIVLKAPAIENLESGLRVYLADNSAGVVQDLGINPEYRFFADNITTDNRFALLFSKEELSLKPENGDSFYATFSNKILTIFPNISEQDEAQLMISNMLGQVLLKQSISGSVSTEIDQHFLTGIYVLSLHTHKGICSKKIFISN